MNHAMGDQMLEDEVSARMIEHVSTRNADLIAISRLISSRPNGISTGDVISWGKLHLEPDSWWRSAIAIGLLESSGLILRECRWHWLRPRTYYYWVGR